MWNLILSCCHVPLYYLLWVVYLYSVFVSCSLLDNLQANSPKKHKTTKLKPTCFDKFRLFFRDKTSPSHFVFFLFHRGNPVYPNPLLPNIEAASFHNTNSEVGKCLVGEWVVSLEFMDERSYPAMWGLIISFHKPWNKDPYQTTNMSWKVRPFFVARVGWLP